MIAYVDSSVLLRIVLGQADRLQEWPLIEVGITSALAEVECLRTLDRHQRRGLLPPDQYAERRGLTVRLLEHLHRVEINRPVLARAAEPFPAPLGTLDAIHLATALAWRRAHDDNIVMATHDRELGLAARAEGFDIVGLDSLTKDPAR